MASMRLLGNTKKPSYAPMPGAITATLGAATSGAGSTPASTPSFRQKVSEKW